MAIADFDPALAGAAKELLHSTQKNGPGGDRGRKGSAGSGVDPRTFEAQAAQGL